MISIHSLTHNYLRFSNCNIAVTVWSHWHTYNWLGKLWFIWCLKKLSFNIFTARQQSCGKLMFSVVSVCLFAEGRGPMWPLPMLDWTSPYTPPPRASAAPCRTLSPTMQSDIISFLLVTSGGQDWRPIQICSLQDCPPPFHQCWHLAGYCSTYDGLRAEHILLECFLVEFQICGEITGSSTFHYIYIFTLHLYFALVRNFESFWMVIYQRWTDDMDSLHASLESWQVICLQGYNMPPFSLEFISN